ncbi:MAG: membrane protein insertase YidC [Bryobacteraceae bacterium]
MGESISGGGAPGQPPKEMSMEIRLLLAFLLMGAVMFLTPYFIKTPPPQPPAKKAETAETAATAPPEAPPVAAAEAQAEPASVPAGPATRQIALPPFVIDTDLFRVTFSNQGATVRSWLLKKYKGNDDKQLEITNAAAGMEYPFSLYLPGQDAAAKTLNWAFFTQTADPDGLGVSFAFSDGRVSSHKTFRFQKNSYILQVSTDVSLAGKPAPNMIAWRGGFGDLTVANAASNQRALHFDVSANKLVDQRSSAAKNGPVSSTGNYSFAGLADAYFAAVFLPRDNAAVEQTTFTNYVQTPINTNSQPFVGVAVSDGLENRFDVFVGPKDYDRLGRLNPKLQQLIDFGWIGILAKPLFLITNWMNDAFVHNYGWSIVLVTVAINFAMFPLKFSNMKSMRKMQALKPQIDAINQKYKGLKLSDPKKADQNQEVMALYKKNGVNPMGGCFPMLLQLPFFFAFYKVFMVSAEMRGASWLWVHDLSQPEQLAIRILPVVMVASQFLMQKMTPQPAGDPNQQKMMMFMPLIFGFMFYQFPSGLVLYYLTSNLVGIGQQLFFNHTAAADEAALSVQPLKPVKKRTVRK